VELPAQGWYRDPYAVHEDRYFSEGTPTKLVRDDGQESFDPPPDLPLPKDQLVPAELPGDEMADGADLHRADEASSGQPYDASAARRAALDVFDASAAT
jgi:hypothetical protein